MKKFHRFPGKLTLCAKFGQKWFCWDFKVLPPHYETINQNFSPIPQIYTPNTTIVTKTNSGIFPSFPEKLTLCAKFEQKWFCWDFEVLPPDYVTINQNFSPILQIYTPNTTILTEENFWKISNFPEKLTLCAKFEQKWFCWDFEVLRPDYVTINQNFSPIPQIYT